MSNFDCKDCFLRLDSLSTSRPALTPPRPTPHHTSSTHPTSPELSPAQPIPPPSSAQPAVRSHFGSSPQCLPVAPVPLGLRRCRAARHGALAALMRCCAPCPDRSRRWPYKPDSKDRDRRILQLTPPCPMVPPSPHSPAHRLATAWPSCQLLLHTATPILRGEATASST